MSLSPTAEPGGASAPAQASGDPEIHPFACSAVGWGADAAWIRVAGELDLTTRERFARTLAGAQSGAHLVVVDLRGLTFMDSAGVHAILAADGRARHGRRRLMVIPGPAQVRRLLALTGADQRLELLDADPDIEPAYLRGQPPARGE